MTLFFLLAALLVVAALAMLLAAPLRARVGARRESDLRATNVALARERRRELDAALAGGAIDVSAHSQELERLERELAAELDALPDVDRRDGTLPAAVLVALFVPIAAGALYLRLGEPEALTRESATAGATARANAAAGGGAAEGAPRAPALDELLPRLEERLAREPDDVEGWRLLGRSSLGIEAFDRAAVALRRAVELDGRDAPTLGQLAEAIAMGRGGALAGEPVELLDRVLALAPEDPQGLWLRAIAHQQLGEHRAALGLFARLRGVISNDAAALETVDAMATRSRAALGEAPADETGRPAGSDSSAAGEGAPASGAAASAPAATAETGADAAVSLRVTLSAEARAASTPEQSVFVYARASDGPPMPLAVARYTVADLPVEVTLDERMAMVPTMSLARFPTVTVGARVSTSGDAIAASGDWFAERDGVRVGTAEPIELLIDSRRP